MRRKPGTMTDIVLVVNAALALELYFKSLLTLEQTKFPWTHDLKDLFALLADSSQCALIRKHKKWEKDPIFARLIADGRKTDLLSLLDIGRKSFDKFRYRHEHLSDGTVWALDVCLCLTRDMVMKKLRIEPHPAFVKLHKG
jgi:hypothetical protein